MANIVSDFLSSNPYGDGKIVTIALLLPEEQSMHAIHLSKQICADQSCSNVLDSHINPPRIRLYETVFPADQIDTIGDEMRAICARQLPLHIHWREVEETKHFISIWCELTDQLQQFQKNILKNIEPLRQGYYKEKYSLSQSGLTAEEKKSLKVWGSPWAEPYDPHLLLAKSNSGFLNPSVDIDWEFHSSVFSQVIVAVKQEHTLKASLIFPLSA